MSETMDDRPKGWFSILKGRAGRAEYGVYVALLFLFCIGLSFTPLASGANGAACVGLLIAQIRRFHDTGRSGWWAVAAIVAPALLMIVLLAVLSLDMAFLIAMAAQLAVIVLVGLLPQEPGANRFGEPAPFSWRRTLTGRPA